MSRLIVVYINGPRQCLPSIFELEHIRDNRKIPFTVNFCTGGAIDFYIENYQTVGDLKAIVCEKLGIEASKKHKYGFLEVAKNSEIIDECYVEDYINACDIIASWEHESFFYKRTLGGIPYNAIFKLQFKMKYWEEADLVQEASALSLNLHYNECCYLFHNLHRDMELQDLLRMCALDLQIKSGDWDKDKQTYVINNYFDRIPNYQCKFRAYLKESKVVADLGVQYESLIGTKRNEAKQEFIDLVKKTGTGTGRVSTFGNILFAVKFVDAENCDGINFPDRMFVGFNMNGVVFWDANYLMQLQLTYDE